MIPHSQFGPNRLHDLLETIREKYITPEAFWALYANSFDEMRVLTVNVEIFKLLLQDRRFLDRADYCTVDSGVLQTAMRITFAAPFERLTGREIVAHSPEYLSRRAVCIFGASEDSRKQALERFHALGAGPGQLLEFNDPIALTDSMLGSAGPRIVGFFAYGFPKQEDMIDTFRALNPHCKAMLIGIGGAIDYFSGTVRQPPELLARLGLEWLWRLALQPKARFRRIAMIVPLALRLLIHAHIWRADR